MLFRSKENYNRGGGYGEAASAKARAQAYRGNVHYNASRPQRTTLPKSAGTPAEFGNFTRYGDEAQRERMSEKSREKRRAEGFKPTKTTLPDIYK